MRAKYRIKELANGEYLLEVRSTDSALWVHVDRFPSLAAADFGIKRLIAKPTWHFDEFGEQMTGEDNNA